jgi:hypothetical protein
MLLLLLLLMLLPNVLVTTEPTKLTATANAISADMI